MKKTLLIVVAVLFIISIALVYNDFNSNQNEEVLTVKEHASTDGKKEESETEMYSQENIFIDSKDGNINVFVKGSTAESNKYIGYNIRHLERELNREEAASNYDVWKLNGAAEYTRNNKRFNKKLDIASPGEWDLAIQESGSNDFVGGSQHGDEITTSITVLVDGNEVDPYGESISQEAQEIVFVIESDLFRDNTITEGEEIIADHYKEYTFNHKGLTVNQEVEFVESIHLNKSYLAMLPIYREENGVQVTDSVSTNFDGAEYDVSEQGFEIDNLTDVNATNVKISGEESGIDATVEILERSSENIPYSFTLSNSELYNKLYFAFVDERYVTTPEEVWSQTTHYNIDTAN